ncbi:MAG: ECF transporter S component [Oscillospiraceae bacterium]|nr:ECF transporter S component [Oscillospiraceae bacterium]
MLIIKNPVLKKMIKISVPFIITPLLVVLGAFVFDSQKHIIISLGIAFFSVILFAAGFERKVSGTRKIVITSVMTALSVTGRFVPLLKPETALIIITGIWLGSESGFLAGAMAAIISNIFFGQGPWTAFQMLALGLTGFFAGVFSKSLRKSKITTAVYGFLCGISYSFIMDIWTVLWYNEGFNFRLYLAALVTAVPYTVLYAVSNALWLWIFSKPFGDKFKRIIYKYGI